MDSFVTIRLSDFAVTGEDAKAGTASTNQPTPTAEIPDELLLVQVAQGSREALAAD